MKKVSFLLICCLTAFTLQAETLKGKWNFEVPEAPLGFQRGTVEFKNVNEKTVATIDFGHLTYDFDIQEIEKDQFTTTVPVMGDEVKVSLDNTNGKMKTRVNAMGMDMDVKLTAFKGYKSK